MKWLVTGGGGFLGSRLCSAILKAGDAISCVGGTCDLTDADAILRAMEGVDGCFHLAGVASLQRCDADPVGSHRLNVGSTVAVLEAAGRCIPPVPVVYASSAAVYGDVERRPIVEDTPCRPLSAYGGAKLSCEIHAMVAHLDRGVPTVGLRFFNLYGPGQTGGVVARTIEAAKGLQPVLIFGSGVQTRDFVHVDDAVALTLAAMCQLRAGPVPAALNICTGIETSVFRMVDMLLCMMGKGRGLIRLNPARRGDIRHSVGSPTLMAHTLGLTPGIDLRDGLRTVI